MKHQITIAIVGSLLYGCHYSKNNSGSTETEKRTSIAYNIHLPDTTKDDWEIMRMKFDGSDKKNITNYPDVAWTYLAYKSRLFFISDRDTCYRCFFLYECDCQWK